MENYLSQQSAQQQPVQWYTGATAGYQDTPFNASFDTQNKQQRDTAALYGTFEDEPPLLEELGIDIPGILQRTSALLLLRLSSPALEEVDMGGALLYAALLGALHLLVGKLHFGVILGWSVVCGLLVHLVASQLAGGATRGDRHSLDVYTTCCLVGYCLLPLLLLSAAAIPLPSKSVLLTVLACVCVLWSTHLAVSLLVRRCSHLQGYRPLLAYPCLLTYSAFALLGVY